MAILGKILIANFYLGNRVSLLNFKVTYQKSRQPYYALGQLFGLVEEKNIKTITSGNFGFEEKLRILLTCKEKHGPVFEQFLDDNNLL